jgi:hypothetical protein
VRGRQDDRDGYLSCAAKTCGACRRSKRRSRRVRFKRCTMGQSVPFEAAPLFRVSRCTAATLVFAIIVAGCTEHGDSSSRGSSRNDSGSSTAFTVYTVCGVSPRCIRVRRSVQCISPQLEAAFEPGHFVPKPHPTPTLAWIRQESPTRRPQVTLAGGVRNANVSFPRGHDRVSTTTTVTRSPEPMSSACIHYTHFENVYEPH